ncbi:MAG: hypothetical protein LBT40_03480, partial [Deltaproteobacteria bacterium]|nr:hypothetical protein [Deltaproteobacteria bacterium]
APHENAAGFHDPEGVRLILRHPWKERVPRFPVNGIPAETAPAGAGRSGSREGRSRLKYRVMP